MLNDDHGDDRMITMNDLEQAGEASDISVPDVVKNLRDAADRKSEASESPTSAQ